MKKKAAGHVIKQEGEKEEEGGEGDSLKNSHCKYTE